MSLYCHKEVLSSQIHSTCLGVTISYCILICLSNITPDLTNKSNKDGATTDEDFSQGIPCPILKQHETWKDVQITNDISWSEKSAFAVVRILFWHSDGYSKTRMTAIQHVITLSDSRPVMTPQYPTPLHYEEAVIKDLKELLEINIAGHCNLAYIFCFLLKRRVGLCIYMWIIVSLMLLHWYFKKQCPIQCVYSIKCLKLLTYLNLNFWEGTGRFL